MTSAHHPHASFHHHHANKTVVRAARSVPVYKASLKVNKPKYTKSDEDFFIDKLDDDDDDMISSFLQFW